MNVDELASFVVGMIFAGIVAAFLSVNYFSVSLISIQLAISKCENANTQLRLVYANGDFKCEDGAFYSRKDGLR